MCSQAPIRRASFTTRPATTTLTMHMSLIRILRDGPAVSLNGSPTVSPVTDALCAADPFPPWWPCSICFLALSHAPPEFASMIASAKPVDVAPARKPMTPATPRRRPSTIGMMIALNAGSIISRCAPLVEMAMQAA